MICNNQLLKRKMDIIMALISWWYWCHGCDTGAQTSMRNIHDKEMAQDCHITLDGKNMASLTQSHSTSKKTPKGENILNTKIWSMKRDISLKQVKKHAHNRTGIVLAHCWEAAWIRKWNSEKLKKLEPSWKTGHLYDFSFLWVGVNTIT